MGTIDQPVEVGFLGAGYIADWHARALCSVRRARLAAVCDRDGSRAHALALRYKVARVYTSLSAMLAEARLGVIHVLLPPNLHSQAAAQIIDAGVHVVLEKPMATCVETCTQLIEQARSKKVKIGVGHNFLFAPVYERLKSDLKSGKLGRPDDVTITWNRGLDQVQAGPFDLWMLRATENVMLEIGPHSVAHMLDLFGSAEIVGARAANPVELPAGTRFFRRWTVEAGQSSTRLMLTFSFAPGFSEHSIHIRGSLASATADFERGTYLLHRHTQYGLDFDRYHMTVSEAKALKAQARRTLAHIVLSHLRPAGGGPYGQSIARALQSFYTDLGDTTDPRLSPELGRDVVRSCIEIGRLGKSEADRQAATPLPRMDSSTPNVASPQTKLHPDILVLGATGFIGQELVRQLGALGRSIRVLVRNPSRLPSDLRGSHVEVLVGNLSSNADLEAALKGIVFVYHLARPLVRTWDDFKEQEIEVTRRVAEACLTAKVGRLIYTGTIDSYYAGAKAGTITEATSLDPFIYRRNYYARSKAQSEDILISSYHQKGLPVIIFRPGIVIGRGGSPFHWGVGMWSYNAVCQIWGRGRNPLPLVLVEDVAQALVTALDAQGIEGESFNLVADAKLSALDYLKALEDCAAVEFLKIPTPPWKFYLVDMAKWVVKRVVRHPDRRLPSYHDWETRTQRAHFDCSKARTRLNWNPTSEQAEIIRRGIQLPTLELLK